MQRTDAIDRIGLGISRYGLVGLLLLWGSFKFFAFEAAAIQPLVEHSPFLSWLYPVFGFRGASSVIGGMEISTGLLIATRRWLPRVSAYGSMLSSGVFVITLSFLITTPGAFGLVTPWSGFLLKDIMFLGASLVTAAEAFAADSVEKRFANQTVLA